MAQAKAGGKSDMNGWTDGVAYTDLTIVQNSYVQRTNGEFKGFNGWDRTGYVPCDGASSITFPPCNQIEAGNVSSNWFYKQDKTPLAGGTDLPFVLSRTSPTTIMVPTGAYYFVISSDSAPLAACINAGIVPHR